jgi:predicted CoA-binding protein
MNLTPGGQRMRSSDAAAAFLALKRIAVVGVSRSGQSPANGIAKRLRETGHDVFAVNPHADTIDAQPSFRSLAAIDGGVDAVVVVTSPDIAKDVPAHARAAGALWIWFHQGFGPESFDDETLRRAREAGLHVISVGCPMMYCEPDVVHRCAKATFRFFGRIPETIISVIITTLPRYLPDTKQESCRCLL